jgi:mannose-6-phosphate isomerase-like protein (cupin superfamily)
MKIKPIVRHIDQVAPIDCPYGTVQRIVTGGEGNGNVHVVRVTEGGEHFHLAYDETYYFLSGTGTLRIERTDYPVAPGTVAVIPSGKVHSLVSDSEAPLEFIIFGTPPMSIDDSRAAPQKPQNTK